MALATRGAAPPDYTALAKGNFNEAFTDSEDEGGGPDAGQRRLDYVLLGKACDAATGFARDGGWEVAPDEVSAAFFQGTKGRQPAVCRASSSRPSTAPALGIELPDDAPSSLTPEWFAEHVVHMFDSSAPSVRTTDVHTQEPGPTMTPTQWAAYWSATVEPNNTACARPQPHKSQSNDADRPTTPALPAAAASAPPPTTSPVTPAATTALPPEITKRLLNVVSLNLSGTRAAEFLSPPTVVPRVDLHRDTQGVRVNLYALMTPPHAYTDWHVDFGGSAVWYHVIQGRKVFYAAPPTAFNLEAFESWAGTSRQRRVSLLSNLQGVVRLVVDSGDTLFLPGGWVHAVYTPSATVAIGGNFLTRRGFGISLDIWRLEDRLGVRPIARFPEFAAITLREADRLIAAMRRATPAQTGAGGGPGTASASAAAAGALPSAAPPPQPPQQLPASERKAPITLKVSVRDPSPDAELKQELQQPPAVLQPHAAEQPQAAEQPHAAEQPQAADPPPLRVRIKAPEAIPSTKEVAADPPLRVRLAVPPLATEPPRDEWDDDVERMPSPSSVSAGMPALTSLSTVPDAKHARSADAANPLASVQVGSLHRVASACGDTAPECAAALKVRLRLDTGAAPSAPSAVLPPADATAAAMLPAMLCSLAASPDHLCPARLTAAGESPPGTPTAPFPAPADLRARAASLLECGGGTLVTDARFPAAEALPASASTAERAALPSWWWEAQRGPPSRRMRRRATSGGPSDVNGPGWADDVDSDEWDERPRKARRRARAAPAAQAPVPAISSVRLVLKPSAAAAAPSNLATAPAAGTTRSHAPSQQGPRASAARPAMSVRSRLEKKLSSKRWGRY